MKLSIYFLFIVVALTGCNDANTSKKEIDEAKKSLTIPQTKVEDPSETNNAQSNQEDWYWKNTTKSNNNKFENWEAGEVSLVMKYKMKQSDPQPRTITVGSIDAEGNIQIKLPSEIETETKLDNLNNLVFYNLHDISNITYENGNTGYFSNTTLQVEKNGVSIGSLTMGNAVRTTYNLVNQSTLTMGDEGYILYLAYLDNASSIKGSEIRSNKVRRDGTNTIEAETTVIYDLDFKSGWNFVKTEVIGNYPLEHERGLNASWFKKHGHTVLEKLPSDAAYFFRKL